jgi:hypothetical protein
VPVLKAFVDEFADMRETFARAREIESMYPGTDGARMIREMLELAESERVEKDGFLDSVKSELARLEEA